MPPTTMHAKSPIHKIDKVSKTTFGQKKILFKNLEEIFTNLIQTLTSEARVLNPKVCGVQGRSPGMGWGVWQSTPQKLRA